MDARLRFRDRLAARPLLADGAMGTLLHARGVPQRAALDELVVTRPDLVGAVHREYLEAGADLIETATFGANRVRLAPYGLAGEAGRFTRRGAQLAREARDVGGRDVLVAGSVGPLGAPTRELLHLDEAEVRAAFREAIDGLLEGGVDVFFIETFTILEHVLIAVDEARLASDLPVVASLTFGDELMLPDGTQPPAAVEALVAARVEAIGVNCGAGPRACLEALEAMAPALAVPGSPARSVLPNAGLPQRLEGRFVFAASPQYFADMTPELVAAGAAVIGGCCGTTPEHVAAMRAALDAMAAGEAAPTGGAAPAGEAASAGGPAPAGEAASAGGAAPTGGAARPHGPAAEVGPIRASVAPGGPDLTVGEAPPPTGLARALAEGRFVVSVEIDPPRSIRIDRILDAARLLKDAGVDLVNISDSAMARVRMGALASAFAIQHDLDLECLVHVTTRDRNLMALESELLGAHAIGVRDILALTGDPPRVGDYPTGTGVWDVDSIGLIEILARLNNGEDAAGSPIGQRAGFTIACALDPTASDAATEWHRLEQKLAAGAHLVMTQPLYSVEQVESMLDEARRRFGTAGFPVPVLLGVLPLHSARHAEFLHNEVPGITIPEATRARMREAGERGTEVGTALALELLGAVRSMIAGVYLMPSFGRYEACAEIARRLRVGR